jgi:hypothetical protein
MVGFSIVPDPLNNSPQVEIWHHYDTSSRLHINKMDNVLSHQIVKYKRTGHLAFEFQALVWNRYTI